MSGPAEEGAGQGTLSTVIVDSICADTTSGHLPHFATDSYRDSVAIDLLGADVAAHTAEVFAPSGAREGVAPFALHQFPAGGSALSLLLMGTLVATALCGQSLLRALKAYRNNLISVRRRNNAFDGIGRVAPQVAALLALLFVAFGGTALYLGFCRPAMPSFGGAATVISIVGAYYILQLAAYNIIGYAFTSPLGRRQWVEGFEASQAFGGILLVAPTLLMLCMPQWTGAMTAVAATVYVCSRLVFVYKGFRIFFKQMWSPVYFVLYLCCAEIIPPLAIMALLQGIGL